MKESTRLFKVLIVLYLIVFLLSLLSKFTLTSIFDDAYMFIRYADNLIKSGSIAWNQSGETTYGPSSLLFLIVITFFRFLLPNNPSLTVVLSSFSCGFIFLFLLALLFHFIKSKENTRYPLFIFLAVSLFTHHADYYLTQHFLTGMDTTFILSFITFYIILNKSYELSPSRLKVVLIGLWGGLAFSARPDLLIYSVCIPVATGLFATESLAKKKSATILVITLTVVATQIFLAKIFLNSPLPLSFYAKGMKKYGENIYQVYHNAPRQFLTEYIKSYSLLFFIIGLDISTNPLQYWKKSTSLEKGSLFATVIFIGYYLFFVLQVMGFLQRFYYPTLPFIIFMASQSFVRVSEKINLFIINLKAKLPQIEPSRYRHFLLIFISLILSIPAISAIKSLSDPILQTRWLDSVNIFKIYNRCNDFDDKVWFGLKEFSTLPNNLVIATTEVGCPGAMNPKKTIVDMAGLNETSISHNGFSTEIFFEKYQPDIIYMPHPDYTRMTKKLKNNRYFLDNYEYISAHELRAALDLALLKDSEYYVLIKHIIENKMELNRDKKFYFDLPRYCFSYNEWLAQIKLRQNRL